MPATSDVTSIGETSDKPEQPWWASPVGQSDRGILLKVEDKGAEDLKHPLATEILLYAAVKTNKPVLPTPPTSSSPGPEDNNSFYRTPNSTTQSLKLYALPLSSDILERAQKFTGLASPLPDGNSHAYFLPDSTFEEEPKSRRRKMSSLFDDATKQRRKAKGKGGESVAQAMANIDRPASQHGILQPSQNVVDTHNQKIPKDGVQRTALSRSTSVGSYQTLDHSRPVSRSGALPGVKRSSLHRVESAYSPRETSIASDMDNITTEQNKLALSKVIMAGMRLHGLQQRKKPSKDVSKGGPSRRASTVGVIAIDEDGEDEYKLVYHQTFKAATFAFRDHLSIRIISQDAMRDIVDRLLDVFCTNPISQHHDLLLGSSDLQDHMSNPFDLPSSSAQAITNLEDCSTPATKKRKPQSFGGAESG